MQTIKLPFHSPFSYTALRSFDAKRENDECENGVRTPNVWKVRLNILSFLEENCVSTLNAGSSCDSPNPANLSFYCWHKNETMRDFSNMNVSLRTVQCNVMQCHIVVNTYLYIFVFVFVRTNMYNIVIEMWMFKCVYECAVHNHL